MSVLENAFSNALNISLFRIDDYMENMTINLNKFIEKGKLKILIGGGIDITYKNQNFISDIIFNDEDENFLKSIDKCDEGKKIVNYKDEKYWSLTYALRGYKIKFYNSKTKYPYMGSKNDGFLKLLILYMLKENHKDMEEKILEIDDIITLYEENSEELAKYPGIEIFAYLLDKYDFLDNKNKEEAYEECLKIIESYKKIKKLLLNVNNILLIEYKKTEIPNFKYSMYKINKNYIIDIYNENNEKHGTIIILDNITSPDITETKLHSDEGCYDSGVNIYRNGLVMIGQQNDNDTMYYASAVYSDIIVPDLL